MVSPQRFVATNFTLRVLIAAAYKLNARAVLGGPSWIDSDHYDIVALNMLQDTLSIAKGGPRLNDSTSPPNQDPRIVNVLFPDHVELPTRNASMPEFAAILQRSIFNRPVVDRTGLTGRYDFDVEWTADSSQFDGLVPEHSESTKPGFFTAIQQQIGLRLEASKGPVLALVIDKIQRPSENR